MPWYLWAPMVAAIFIVPWLIARVLSRAANLPDHEWKIYLVLFTTFAAAAITVTRWPPRLGIDLSGGSILVYEVDQSQKKSDEPVDMDKLLAAVTRRVNPGGIKEVTVRPYGVEQVEIIIPEAQDQEELDSIKRLISSTGALEFRILANTRDHESAIEQASALALTQKVLYSEGADGVRQATARWAPVRKEEQERYRNSREFGVRNTPNGGVEVLLMIDPYNVTGQYLSQARASRDEGGQPSVDFVFNAAGARLFEKLTAANLPEQQFYRNLGIVLDGYLQSAPVIRSIISDRGQITGSFTVKETDELASILTSGSLPTALSKEPSSSLLTGPTLGQDTIRKGVNAMIVSTIAVIVFMLVYYRFAGLVANLALLLNILLIVAFMIAFKAAFTLSGLAGLALTVGMAVDANVLIYERMREELARGSTLRMAIRNGFGRATTTIVDANLTTLIAGIVLYVIGTDQVKGFAVTLILGVLMNLFTAIFCSRVAFDLAEKLRIIKTLRMMKILDNTNFDFIGKRKIAAFASIVVIAIGLAAVVQRGQGLLDIDFTGGTSVQLEFVSEQSVADIRTKLADAAVADRLPDVTVQDVQIADIEGQPTGTQFIINTSNQDVDAVERDLSELFAGQLVTNRMTIAKLVASDGSAPVDTQPPAESPASDESAKPAAADQSRIQSTLADAEGLLAQAEGTAPTEPTATEQPAPDTAPADTAPADSAPAESPPAAADSDAAATDAAVPEATAATDPALADSIPGPGFTQQSSAELQFAQSMSHDHLMEELNRVKAASDDQEVKNAILVLSNPEYEPGRDASFKAWTLSSSLPLAKTGALLERVQGDLAEEPWFPSSSSIGAAVAGNTRDQAVVAILASLALILGYIWLRFTQVMFGLAAILALVHDVLVTLGALALSYYVAPYLGFALVEPFKISLPIVAAFLTIIGYSLNDTIVIFDRVREVRGKSPHITAELVNLCINQTLSRTILTSVTVLIVVVILYAMGGQGIHGFSFALLVGCTSGVYSTIYIATPVLLWMDKSSTAPRKAPAEKGRSPAPSAAR